MSNQRVVQFLPTGCITGCIRSVRSVQVLPTGCITDLMKIHTLCASSVPSAHKRSHAQNRCPQDSSTKSSTRGGGRTPHAKCVSCKLHGPFFYHRSTVTSQLTCYARAATREICLGAALLNSRKAQLKKNRKNGNMCNSYIEWRTYPLSKLLHAAAHQVLSQIFRNTVK